MSDHSTEARARALRQQGLIYKEIGEALGVHKMTAYRMVNSQAREADREHKRRARRQRSRDELLERRARRKPSRDELLELARGSDGQLDTRTITGILCGDPLPGRSALDLRGR